MEISLTAEFEGETKPLTFGKFKLYNGQLDVAIIVDPEATPVISLANGFSMKVKANAEVLGARFDTTLGMKYAGGNIQSMTGSVSAPNGVKIGTNMLVTGGGGLDWSTTAGLAVTIGSPDPASAAGFAYCTGGVQETPVTPATNPVTTKATCTGADKYSFDKAYLDFSPKGFAAAGTLTIGTTFTGQLSGFYYHEAAQGKAIKFGSTVLAPDAEAGDFGFSLEDATLNLPSGQTNASVGVAKYGGSPGTVAAKLAFEIPMLGGKVKFDGTYDTAGLYDIAGGAANMSIGGFTLDDGNVRVRNYNISAGSQRDAIPQTIDIDVKASLATWGKFGFKGKFGSEDNAVGYRLTAKGDVQFSTVTANVAVSYSNFPKDAGFGFFTNVTAGPVTVAVAGVFRKVPVNGVDTVLFRGGGAISVPIVPGVAAQGMAQMDNCINDVAVGTACASARLTGSPQVVTPQIKIAAGVSIGKGLATAAVQGEIGFDGAFRMVGSAQAGVSMGPWGFFGIITAEAGFKMNFGVCIANTTAINRDTKTASASARIGCGREKMDMWVVGLKGEAWAGVTMNLWLFKVGIKVTAELAGVIGPDWSKFCAVFGAFGFKITFGTCPGEKDIPYVDPTLEPNDYVM